MKNYEGYKCNNNDPLTLMFLPLIVDQDTVMF